MSPDQVAIVDQSIATLGAQVDGLIATVQGLKAKGASHEQAICDVTTFLHSGDLGDALSLSALLAIAVSRLSFEGGAAS